MEMKMLTMSSQKQTSEGDRSQRVAESPRATSPLLTRGGILQMQRVAGNRATSQMLSALLRRGQAGKTIQRNIDYDATNNQYKGTTDRPGFLVEAERQMMDKMNDRLGTNHTVDKFNYQTHKMDRAHIVAFSTLQDWVVSYLNSKLTYQELFDRVKDLVPNGYTGAYGKDISMKMTELESLIKGGAIPQDILKKSNKLLSLLNSIPENLNAGSKYINAAVHDHVDPVFNITLDGYSLTDDARRALNMGAVVGSLGLSNGEVLSSINGSVQDGNMTPRSKSIVTGFQKESVNINSDKTKKAIADAKKIDEDKLKLLKQQQFQQQSLQLPNQQAGHVLHTQGLQYQQPSHALSSSTPTFSQQYNLQQAQQQLYYQQMQGTYLPQQSQQHIGGSAQQGMASQPQYMGGSYQQGMYSQPQYMGGYSQQGMSSQPQYIGGYSQQGMSSQPQYMGGSIQQGMYSQPQYMGGSIQQGMSSQPTQSQSVIYNPQFDPLAVLMRQLLSQQK